MLFFFLLENFRIVDVAVFIDLFFLLFLDRNHIQIGLIIIFGFIFVAEFFFFIFQIVPSKAVEEDGKKQIEQCIVSDENPRN